MYILRNLTKLNNNNAQRKFTLVFGKEIRALAREWAQKLQKQKHGLGCGTLPLIVWLLLGNSSTVLILGFLVNSSNTSIFIGCSLCIRPTLF